MAYSSWLVYQQFDIFRVSCISSLVNISQIMPISILILLSIISVFECIKTYTPKLSILWISKSEALMSSKSQINSCVENASFCKINYCEYFCTLVGFNKPTLLDYQCKEVISIASNKEDHVSSLRIIIITLVDCMQLPVGTWGSLWHSG